MENFVKIIDGKVFQNRYAICFEISGHMKIKCYFDSALNCFSEINACG